MAKNWVQITEVPVENFEFNFWNGINVWIERSHLVNKKIVASETIHEWVSASIKLKLDGEISATLNKCCFHNTIKELVFHINCLSDVQNEDCTIKIIKLVPRNAEKFCTIYQIVLTDPDKKSAIFWPNETVITSPISPPFPYKIQFWEKRIIIEAFKDTSKKSLTHENSEEWLKSSVLPKLIKWSSNLPTSKILPSLSAVSITKYCENYQDLKFKYGKKYVNMWPESSDPLKYVYEDIAIAAYLMTFWEQERIDLHLSSKQSFIDIGCGNGLLVDILTTEGYTGMGIDVRRRKIWNFYNPNTNLVEMAVEPSDKHLFPEYDWIIGNHSDELTPWIPIIAARSSYKMRFFLLPCCFYTFNGKYERHSAGTTQYESYMKFIEILCESSGFKVIRDKLRIPSTKRICFIGVSRTYDEDEGEEMDSKRTCFIQMHSKLEFKQSFKKSAMETSDQNQNNISEDCTKSVLHDVKTWVDNFKPRDRIETVQNCTKLDEAYLERTVKLVADILLKTQNHIALQKGLGTLLWNAGGRVKLVDLINLMESSILKKMKNQCGGFQTFLRNHKNVFQITDGFVQLTIPNKELVVQLKHGRKRKYKGFQYRFHQKKCYFHFHHPQGCPLENDDCAFSHEK